MPIFSAMTTLPSDAAAKALCEALERLDPAPYGVGNFAVDGDLNAFEVGAFFYEKPDDAGLSLLSAAFGSEAFAVTEVADRDWVGETRRDLAPVRVGRFLIHGSHDRPAARGVRHSLEIEAAMAFGTGHHGTTRGCLLALDRLARIGLSPRRIADIGCGTGVLSMAAASLWRRRCIASDLDPVAIDTARANFRANRLTYGARLVRAAGFASPVIRAGGPYDLILANILARPLKRMAPAMARRLAPGGVVILSGVLNEQRKSVEAVYRGNGFRRMWIGVDGEWSTLVFLRSAALRRSA